MAAATVTVTVGVCAFNEAARMPGLLASLLSQELPSGHELLEVLVVSSGSTDDTDAIVAGTSAMEPRVRLIREPEREGKASALNRILEAYQGDILVIVNGDARLDSGSLAELLRPFHTDPHVVVACGSPVPESGQGGVNGALQAFLWAIHNNTLRTLSDLEAANHCCDELFAMRRGFLEFFPAGLINDGAYIGAIAALHGHSVRFCPQAQVHVRIPRSLFGLLQQRRRILRGHRQMTELLQHPPNTLRSLARVRPGLAATILLEHFQARPRDFPVFLLLALPLETAAGLFAIADGWRSVRYPAAWPMVDRL